jgi:hypothetical protein
MSRRNAEMTCSRLLSVTATSSHAAVDERILGHDRSGAWPEVLLQHADVPVADPDALTVAVSAFDRASS